jgi:G patch domain-containing protein 2
MECTEISFLIPACAPLPTEDSSSSPADPPNNNNNNNVLHTSNATGDVVNTIQSDSDDRHAFAFKMRQTPMSGNFESDSFNENFSPRPNTRRKRKFKRMAVEYETTTPSTPGNSASTPLFPALAAGSGTVKKHRVLKHTCQDNFRANFLFCGKRKRSHRERYLDYDSQKQHSSSVPRQRDIFAPKGSASYLEYRNRNRGGYSGCSKPCERIMPLTKTIVSKIEKISQDSKNKIQFNFAASPQQQQLYQDTLHQMNAKLEGHDSFEMLKNTLQQQMQRHGSGLQMQRLDSEMSGQAAEARGTGEHLLKHLKMAPKSGSFESALTQESSSVPMTATANHSSSSSTGGAKPYGLEKSKHSSHHHHHHHSGAAGGGGSGAGSQASHNRKAAKHQRRRQLKMQQLQFDDQTFMDCGGLNEFLSSSSLSSSDSEAILTNESDHEGDDELTDWPGNEAMINFASKNDFKRAKPRSKPSLPQIKQQDDCFLDDDTLMSADDVGNLTVETSVLGNMPGFRPGMAGEGPATQMHHQQAHHHNHHPQQPPNTLNLGEKWKIFRSKCHHGSRITKQGGSKLKYAKSY